MNKYVVMALAFLIGYWVVSQLFKRSGKKADPAEKFDTGHDGSGASYDPQGDDHGEIAIEDNWHRVLSVSENATYDEIVTAYRRLIRQYHPDRVSGLAPEIVALAERQSKQINLSFEYAKKIRGR